MTDDYRREARTRPLVSVIIPTRDRVHCLPVALQSVHRQDGLGEHFDVEVIVVDDGSSDATGDVVGQYPRVRYVRFPERRGVSAALNAGLRAARGAFITFLGDDDEFLPHKLRVQVSALLRHPRVGVVYGQHVVRSERGEVMSPKAGEAPSGSIFSALLTDNCCAHHASLLIRREVFDRVGGFDESLASYEDHDLSLRMAFEVPFLFLPGAVDIYNVSPTGLWLSQAVRGEGSQDAARVLEKALRMLPDSARYGKIKRRARGYAAVLRASPFVKVGDPGRAWGTAVTAVGMYPDVLRGARARGFLRWVACEHACAAESPLAATVDCCRQIKSAARGSGLVERWAARRTIAAIYAEMAFVLAADRRAGKRDAAYAAVCAVAQAPWQLRRSGLFRLIVRGELARSAPVSS